MAKQEVSGGSRVAGGQAEGGALGVERRSIDFVPPEERHGSVRSLFTVWFGANMQVTTAVTGALGVILGLPLPWAIVALILGNLLGAIFMALHSAQGPKLGIPQMIQSRAQFGFYGAIVPLLLVVLMYVGFFATSAVLGGSALAGWWGIGRTPATIIVSAVCTVLAAYGYRLIHQYERWISLIAAIGFLYLTYRLLTDHYVGRVWHSGHVGAGTFLLVVAIAATWQITYAPYVADYSRYLPESTSVRAAFWWTYAGSVVGTVWMMAFGSVCAAVAAKSFEGGSVSFVVGLGGPHWAFSLIIVLGIIAVNVLNLYGMFMSATTTLTALRPMRMNGGVRLGFIIVAALVGTVVALAASADFLHNFENFILFLAYFLIPWTAINLVDFYFVRKERYDIDAIFRPDGVYGGVNWRTIGAYAIGVLVEVPFVSSTFYTGPFVKHLGGADISWIIGLVVASVLYYVWMRPVARDQVG
ncbi:cytosine permease [Actinoallomurus sp. NPDC052274]|uniref:purine-cytosine permease family protein n=1 Tax=Actinoallomurus sp. NPDC052274 TaxID=3155420 RepID=UPI00341C59E4